MKTVEFPHSIGDVVRRTATPHDAVLGRVEYRRGYAAVSVHPRARIVPGLVAYRLDDRHSLANATCTADGAPDPVRWAAFDAEVITQVDATGLAAFGDVIDALEASGVGFAVARLKTPWMRCSTNARLTERIGKTASSRRFAMRSPRYRMREARRPSRLQGRHRLS